MLAKQLVVWFVKFSKHLTNILLIDATSKATSLLVSGLSYLTQKGAEKLAPHISEFANRNLQNDSKEKVHGFSLVAHSSMQG